MAETPRDDTASPKQNESGPNYFAYYKHLVLDLLSENGNCFVPSFEVDSAISSGKYSAGQTEESYNNDGGSKVKYFLGPSSYFTGSVGEGLSEYKKERLLSTLSASAVCFSKEVDKILEHILATFEIGSTLREKERSPSYSKAASDEALRTDLNCKRRKSHLNCSSSNSFSRQLDKMEENLEEYINIVVSKCRPMTHIEKHRLGKMIRKLPAKALNHVVEILQPSKFSTKDLPESIFVNLEEEDNVKLWRLYYYVELVLKTNKI